MMNKIDVPPDAYTIKLKGFKSKDKTCYVSFNGTIESYHSEYIHRFEMEYDRSIKVLGAGRMHARS